MASVATALLEVLNQIDRPGSFCTSGEVSPVLPGLEVDGIGAIGLPLTRSQADELACRCQPAPYGKGEETLVDERVRRVLELDVDHFSLNNPAWAASLKPIIDTVQAELGLEDQTLESHLYKLLLYESGSFFLSHRDGEKLDHMVATLVIALPSAHEGGELLVRHDGEEYALSFGGPESPYRTSFAAFYADCEHEIRPIRSGHRLCLVYNLTLARSKAAIAAPQRSPHVEAIEPILQRWRADEYGPDKLVITLDHQYTESGLSPDALKGLDRVKAHVLFEAARRTECLGYLAVLTLWESGLGEESGDGWREYDRHYDDDYDDEDEHEAEDDDENNSGAYEMLEVFETGLTASHWRDRDGVARAFGEMGIDEDVELVSKGSLTDVDPKEHFEGYTGNAGMTLDRWYRHGAVFLWPKARHYDILCSVGVAPAVSGLAQMVTEWEHLEGATAGATRDACIEFAQKIIARWPVCPMGRAIPSGGPTTQLLPLLDLLNEGALIRAFLRDVLAYDPTQDAAEIIVSLCERHGWQTFEDEVSHVIEATSRETLERNARLVERLCVLKEESDGWRALCHRVLKQIVSALERCDTEREKPGWRASNTDRSSCLTPLVRSLAALDDTALFERLIDHVTNLTDRYNLTSVQMATLTRLHPWLCRNAKTPSLPLARWLEVCRHELKERTEQAPEKPRDWRRAAELSCRCEDCAELARFLADAGESVHRFKVRKDRRRHLHQVIEHHQCDVEHVTNRRGSPHTLVCTKNVASYKRERRRYHLDLEHLEQVELMYDDLCVERSDAARS